jgi:DNA ligase-1
MLERWCAFYREIKSTNSSIQKKLIVPKYADLLPLWRHAFRPTYLTSASLNKHRSKRRKVEVPSDLLTLMYKLTSRSLVGNAALDTVLCYMDEHVEYTDELIALFSGNLKLGLDIKSMNQALIAGGCEAICQPFVVCLAQPYQSMDFVKEPWYIMRKYDGIRCLVKFDMDGSITAYTRYGNKIASIQNALSKLIAPTKGAPTKGFYLDSEIVTLETKTGTEDFSASLSKFRQSKVDVDVFHCIVFDMLSIEEFEHGESKLNWSIRMGHARKFCEELKDNRFIPIDYELYTEDVFSKWQTKQTEQKWEGLILRKDTKYRNERTFDLLKIKKFHTFEAIVKDITISVKQMLNPQGLMEDVKVMASVIIEYKNSYVHVGSGFTDEQRIQYMKHPEDIIGKMIEISYLSELNTKGKFSLRHPSFKCVWGQQKDA